MTAGASRAPQEVLRDYLTQNGLKASHQRDVIADVFFSGADHMTIDELLQRAREVDTKVSIKTKVNRG